MSDPLRAKLNLLMAAAVAFAFGLGLASALDLTPFSVAADERRAPEIVIGAPHAADVTLNGGFADVVEQIAPTVVTIHVEQQVRMASARRFPLDEFFRDPRDRRAIPDTQEEEPRIAQGSGSGFIISADGYILTNNHVIENAQRIEVELADQRTFANVELIGRDPQTDVAVLKVDAEGLPVAPLGFSDSTRVGEWVLAIGSPGFGRGLPAARGPGTLESTVTAGIVSAKGRNIQILDSRRGGESLNYAIEDFIQTDAVINRGNSGGPLINARGEVIGINTAIASETGVYEGYGFAVPIELAREVLDDLIEHGEVRRAVIGVGILPVTAADAEYYQLGEVRGALVNGFTGENSPAQQAGIRLGDVITAVEGEPVNSVGDLQRRIRQYDPGEVVRIDVVRRDRSRESVRVRLAAAETGVAPEDRVAATTRRDDALGILQIEPLTASERRAREVPEGVDGVLITDAQTRGPLGRALRVNPTNMIIQDVNGRSIRSVEDYERAVAGLEPGDAVNVQVALPIPTRQGVEWQSQFVSIVIPR